MYLFSCKGVLSLSQLLRSRKVQVIFTYIAMQLSTVLVTLLLLTFTDMDESSAIIYPNIVAFMVGLIIIWLLLRESLQTEKEQHPLTVGRIVIWSIIGFLLAWGSQILAITI